MSNARIPTMTKTAVYKLFKVLRDGKTLRRLIEVRTVDCKPPFTVVVTQLISNAYWIRR
jgi:hypothetical protein